MYVMLLYVVCLEFPLDNNIISSVGCTETGRVTKKKRQKIKPMTPATSVIRFTDGAT